MLVTCSNDSALESCKAYILATLEMKGYFHISDRYFLELIAMNPYLQKNSTDKVASTTRNVVGRGGGRGSGRGSEIISKSCVQVAMSSINKNYFRGSERGYVPTA